MKKILFLSLLPFFCLAQTNKLDQKNGFKTYIFGASPKEFTNLVLEIDEGNTKLYSLGQSNINLDGAEFEYIRITFCKDKLSAISLQTKNSTGQKFLSSLKENYGEPGKSNKQKENYEWLSSKCQLVYEKNARSNDATISFYAKTICKNKK
ncbi:MAG: hypothetical protein H0W73_06025 [Bacteroidetes bacterium]|nr:hypothetical protein [Bacteroidota bacterium]